MATYFKISDLSSEMHQIRTQSVLRGRYCGLNALDEIYTAKKGYPLFIAGAPHSGKTEFLLELMMSWSELYGWKHCIFLGENGTPAEIYAELCHKRVRKPFRLLQDHGQPNSYAMSDTEMIQAQMWVGEHFIVVGEEFNFNFDSQNSADYTIKSWYKHVNTVENELGISFDTTAFDPFNDLDEENDVYGGRIDKYLKAALKYVRGVSRHFKRIDVLVTHIADLKAVYDSKTKGRYYPEALPNEWSGGRVWYRRAFTMLLVYRPPKGLDKGVDGEVYQENETIIINQKAKPKGSGKLGRASIYWDWQSSRYYEVTDRYLKRFSGPKEYEGEKLPTSEIDGWKGNDDFN